MSKIFDGSLVGKRESVVDQLLLLNEHQTPLISLLGFSNPVTQTEHQWFEDEMFADESTATAGGNDVETTVTVADPEPYRANQVIKIGEELLLVTAVSGNDLTVTRGYADTQAAAFEAEDKVEVMFVEGEEGSDARSARYKPRKRVSNLTQIFDETISITGTAAAVANYGIDDIYNHEQAKKMMELALQLEKAAINGIKYDNGSIRQMKGIRSFIETNVTDASAAEISKELLNNSIQDIYEKGGFATGGNYKIMVGANQKRKISKFTDDQVRYNRDETTRGVVVDQYVSDFGVMDVVLNNNLKKDEILIVDANRIAIKPLQGREFTHEYLGKTGDHFTGMLVGEYTLQFAQEKAHARIKGLA